MQILNFLQKILTEKLARFQRSQFWKWIDRTIILEKCVISMIFCAQNPLIIIIFILRVVRDNES